MTTPKSRPHLVDKPANTTDIADGQSLDMAAIMAAVTVGAGPLATTRVDIGAFLVPPVPIGAAVLTLRELDAPRLFQTGDDGAALRRLNPDWPETLAVSVALLAQAHAAPPMQGTPTAEFYARVANTNRRLLTHLLMRYKEAFPESYTIGQDEAEAKNG